MKALSSFDAVYLHRDPVDFRKAINGLAVIVEQHMQPFSGFCQRTKTLTPFTIRNRCGAAVKIIACIEDPSVIKKILDHLDAKSMALPSANQLPEPRDPPQAELFD